MAPYSAKRKPSWTASSRKTGPKWVWRGWWNYPPSLMAAPPVSPFFVAMADQTSLQFAAVANTGGYSAPGPDELYFDSRAAHAAEIGAAGGITNARGLAGMYAPLANGGTLHGVSLVSRDSLARMSAVSSASGLDTGLLLPTRFSLGYA